MKNIRNIMMVAIAALMFVSSPVFAAAGDTIIIDDSYGINKIKIEISQTGAPFTVLIRQKNGDIVFNDLVKTGDKFAKYYDLSTVEAGRYSVEVYAQGAKNRQTFYVDGEFLMVKKSYTENNPAYFNFANNKLNISYLNERQLEASLELLNIDGQVIFQDNLRNALVIQKRYDFTKLRVGEYTAVISSGDQKYSTSFTISK